MSILYQKSNNSLVWKIKFLNDKINSSWTYWHFVKLARWLSIFSIGGHWKIKETSVASEAFCPFFSSHLLTASLIVVGLDYKQIFNLNVKKKIVWMLKKILCTIIPDVNRLL